VIRRWLSLIAVRAGLRALGWVLRVAAAAGLVIAALPVSLTAACGVALAWLNGWPPRRLYRAVLYCAPMVAVWLAATAVTTRSAAQVAAAPYLAGSAPSRPGPVGCPPTQWPPSTGGSGGARPAARGPGSPLREPSR
jgi:hypothetical protein